MSEQDSLREDGVSIFRPSYSATWLGCEDALVSGFSVSDTAGYDAAVGTVFHDIMHEWLTKGKPEYRLGDIVIVKSNDGKQSFEVTVDDDMFSFGDECIKHLSEIVGGTWYFEQRVDISHITPIPNQGGTADVINVRTGRLVVIDYKYGKGVQVFAHRNSQGLCYLSGAFEEFDYLYHFTEIEFWIYQPRFDHWDVYRPTREELLDWAAWARVRAGAAWKPDGRVRTPSPKACQWCRVREDCAALEMLREALVDDAFEENRQLVFDPQQTQLSIIPSSILKGFQFPAANKLNTAQLSDIRQYRKLMDDWFKDIERVLIERITDGDESEHWDVGIGRTRGHWRDNEEAADLMSLAGFQDDQIYVRSLVSPNQSKKVFRELGLRGKALDDYVKQLTARPPGKPVLKPKGDARASIPDYSDAFDTEEDEDGSESDDPAAI